MKRNLVKLVYLVTAIIMGLGVINVVVKIYRRLNIIAVKKNSDSRDIAAIIHSVGYSIRKESDGKHTDTDHNIQLDGNYMEETSPQYPHIQGLSMQERGIYVQKMCKTLSERERMMIARNKTKFRNRSHAYVYPSMNLTICLIPKVGLTNIRTILGMPRLHQKLYDLTNEQLSYNKVMFVRDPYTRLLSAYIDKFYVWKKEFKSSYSRILSERRLVKDDSYKTVSSAYCDYNISFKEFINHVVYSMWLPLHHEPAEHWYPYTLLCSPCDINYTSIGMIENMNHDWIKFWASIGVSPKVASKTKSETERERALMELFNVYNTTCIQLQLGLKKAWMALQIQGIVSHNIKYPFSHVTRQHKFDEIKKVFLEKLKHPVNYSDVLSIRRMTLRLAYGTLDSVDFRRLGNMFKRDFTLYGYPKRPSYLNEKLLSFPQWTPFVLDKQ